MDGMYEQQPVSSDEIFAASQQEIKIQNVLQQIAPDNQLMDLQWRIKGYIRDVSTGQWRKIDPDSPEPHPVLVSRYISYLSSILNQNTTFSNYSSPEINQIMGLVIKWIVDDLDSNAELYGLEEDYTERSRIGFIILNSTFSSFKRALNGTESRRIFKTLNLRENLSGDSEKKGGIGESLKFWK